MNDYIGKPIEERVLYNKSVGLVKKPVAASEPKKEEGARYEKLKCIDLGYLNHRTKSNRVMMMEMISVYIEQTPVLIATIKKSFHDKDWDALQVAVHKIIPSFSIMGIHQDFESIAKKIHEYARAQQESGGIGGLFLQLKIICLQACNELEVELNLIKNLK